MSPGADPDDSFILGWETARKTLKDWQLMKLQTDICERLGVDVNRSWYSRLRGRIKHTPAERRCIMEVFAEYGIDKVFGVPQHEGRPGPEKTNMACHDGLSPHDSETLLLHENKITV